MKSLSSNTDLPLVGCVASWGYELHGNGGTQEEACLRPTEVQHVWVRYILQQNGITKLPHYDTVPAVWRNLTRLRMIVSLILDCLTTLFQPWLVVVKDGNMIVNGEKQGCRYENRAHGGPWLLEEIARKSVGRNQAGTLRLKVCCFD